MGPLCLPDIPPLVPKLFDAGKPGDEKQAPMRVDILRTKLLRAEVTGARLDYEGSLAIDSELLALVGMLPYEKILIGNITNGQRFETYAIPAPAGTREVCLNGGTAHLGRPGDLLTIMSFAQMTTEEARAWRPRTVTLAERNRRIVRIDSPEAPADLLKTFLR